ncbi:hypothetical protein V8J38_11235 [Brevundimonas olei]|uniref:Uncharacterized protein n=1 Tax=Brevundimonas olei TaxID=657642 RepID=A0ABZ2ICR7_9CAUL
MSVRALDGDGMAGSVRTMAHPCKSANTTVIDMLVDSVLARFPRIMSRLREADSGLEVSGDGGTSI